MFFCDSDFDSTSWRFKPFNKVDRYLQNEHLGQNLLIWTSLEDSFFQVA